MTLPEFICLLIGFELGAAYASWKLLREIPCEIKQTPESEKPTVRLVVKDDELSYEDAG